MNRKIILSFLFGGTLLGTVQYILQTSDSLALAAVAASFPIGLFSIYLVKPSDSREYIRSYFFIACILLASIFFLFTAQKYVNNWGEREKYLYTTLTVLLYVFLVFIRTKYAMSI